MFENTFFHYEKIQSRNAQKCQVSNVYISKTSSSSKPPSNEAMLIIKLYYYVSVQSQEEIIVSTMTNGTKYSEETSFNSGQKPRAQLRAIYNCT